MRGRKRPREVELTRKNRTKARKHHPAVQHGRHFARTVEMFAHPATVINEGIQRMFDENEGIQYSYDKSSQRRYAAYRALERMMPTLPDTLAEDEDAPDEISAAVAHGASGARSDDTNSIKTAIVEWLTEPIEQSNIPMPAKDKSRRGHNHPVSSKLLAPAALQWTPE
ncbi:hypothetical protein K474DRAFT_1609141 [Panus rudis PR-1116 ss-1]|nr:hypothetical protein K474DRAFT_1609197 [Panus rudis PR-1116 ss-1]KAI0070193.1 hypothetical protein K474DRAFT_1609141 [Panus rudis PR-1116 ss-1]